MNNDFYLYLKSDASSEIYPENTQHSFKVKLREQMNLKGDWVCAVQQVHGVLDFDNVTDGTFRFRSGDGPWHNGNISEGRYDTAEALVNAIQAVIDHRRTEKHLILKYDKVSNKLTIILFRNSAIQFTENLAWILGFTPNIEINNVFHDDMGAKLTIFLEAKPTDKSRRRVVRVLPERCVDVMLDYHHLLIYCDLIEPQLVGHTSVELLRIIDLTSLNGQHNTEFMRPNYFPLKRNNFQTVEIFIRRESGRIPTFTKGKLNLVFYILKRKIYYYENYMRNR